MIWAQAVVKDDKIKVGNRVCTVESVKADFSGATDRYVITTTDGTKLHYYGGEQVETP